MFQRANSPEKVDQLLTQFPGPILLRPSKVKAAIVLAFLISLSSLFVLGLLTSKFKNWYEFSFLAAITAGSTLSSIFYFSALKRGSSCMMLDKDGFGFPFALWTTPKFFWRTTHNFRAGAGVSFLDDSQPPSSWKSFNRLLGGDRIIKETYGLGSNGLAKLMSAWRERALALDSKKKNHGSSSVSQ